MDTQQKPAKLYILVRSDIPVPDQAVQISHATELWAKTISMHGLFRKGATVLVSISGNSVDTWIRKIHQKCLSFCYFQEPDMDNIITAIACHTDTNIFSSLPIWTGEPSGEPVY